MDKQLPAENQQQLTQCSTRAMTNPSEFLKPATAKAGTAELLACLTLVAPSGMTAEDRNAWVQVARETLKGIPGDLLQRGCRAARERCRFASEIVPTIFEVVGKTWEGRLQADANRRQRELNRNALPQPKPEYVTAAEVRKLIKSISWMA